MDLVKIEELIRIVKDATVSEMTLRQDGKSITIKKAAGAARPAAAPKKAPVKREESGVAEQPCSFAISAPMVGIFHAAAAAVQLGAIVRPGQVVGAIESMKLMNDIVADVSGTVLEIDTDDGLPVEYGQTLFRLAPLEGERT